jgi:glutamine amidotransferase-like uncharacterized protein
MYPLRQSTIAAADNPPFDGILTFPALLVAAAALALCAVTACDSPAPRSAPQVLLFNGMGTSPNDVAALAHILNDKQIEFATVNSSQLNDMSGSQLKGYRLIIMPGGNYIDIGAGLTSSATANIRTAVQGGMNYLGICAGAFLAGNTSHNCVNLTSGVQFDFYADTKRGIRKAAVSITTPDAPAVEHYWEDGPQLAGWGAVVGKYPDGTPAIVESNFGKGFVILCGVHPEAPENWRQGMTFATATSAANAYAATLIDAALQGTWLPHY